MKTAFSTVACPDWTLTQVAERCEPWGYQGVELRTFGHGSTQIACDPALSSPAKVRAMFAKAGVQVCCLATSARFDDRVTPPVIGHFFDQEQEVRLARSCVDLAVELECPFVRVFGFEIIGAEARGEAVARIADRLAKVADHCRNSGVRLVLENGGSFGRSADLAELIDRVGSPLLSAAYCPAVARAAGELPADGMNVLAGQVAIVKLRDFAKSTPCGLGKGDHHSAEDGAALAKSGFSGWAVYEYDRLWFRGAPAPDTVLGEAAATMYHWIAGARPQPKTFQV